MRFPLNKKIVEGYRFMKKTFYSKHHLGTDWRANFENLYAPTKGKVIATPYGVQGGQWLHFIDDKGRLHRFGHLSVTLKKGPVNEGELIAITGATGQVNGQPMAPHLHHDISKNGKLELNNLSNFIDPELIFKYNNMRYVRVENEQYLLYEEPFKIAFNIADIDELIHLEAKGMKQEIEIITPEELLQYEIYPLVSKPKVVEIVNQLKDYFGIK